MEKYILLEKAVGETPLSCAEAYRANHPELTGVSMAYAGRLDPMASGKLLVLLGEECKNQTAYHGLDKEYEFSVLLGIGSDSHDVLGRLGTDPASPAAPSTHTLLARPSHFLQKLSTVSTVFLSVIRSGTVLQKRPTLSHPPTYSRYSLSELQENLQLIGKKMTGTIELPYPHFSAKTVQGKPLHMWTLENRLDEIEIPTKESTIYSLKLDSIETKSRAEVCAQARAKIDSIPEVTEARKALGNDFRRIDVRKDWESILTDDSLPDSYHIAHFTCLASSGTYMRTLAHLIGQRLSPPTPSLAWSIHRKKIGIFNASTQTWTKEY